MTRYVTTKPVRLEQKHVEKIEASGKSYSQFIRDAIEAYDLNYDTLVLQATVESYSQCITKLKVEQEFVIQRLQNLPKNGEIVTHVLQNDTVSTEIVSQKDTNHAKTGEIVTQTPQEENLVLQKCDTNIEESAEIVTQIESDPLYPKMEEHLPLLSRQLNLFDEVPKETKQHIAYITGIPKQKITTFLYEFKNEIKKIPYEIPDIDDRVVEKKYNRLTKKLM